MGLFDTMPHLGLWHEDEDDYNLTVNGHFQFTASAVAMNEHRGGPADFGGRSVFYSAPQRSNDRIGEQGSIGSHADIGASYATGDLSDVVLMWMIESAKKTGVGFSDQKVSDNGWNVVTAPIVHDKSRNILGFLSGPLLDDRKFVYGDGKSVKQSKVTSAELTTEESRSMVAYGDSYCGSGMANTQVGVVDMDKYAQWLQSNIPGFVLQHSGVAKPCP